MAEREIWQPRATTAEGIRIEKAAIFLLSRIISWSVKEQKEYGGVIYRVSGSGLIKATGPIAAAGSANTVDVGQNEINLGLPSTSVPGAWYHTHPLKQTKSWSFEWNKFEDGDRRLSNSRQIPGYVATMDGYLWRFDPSPEPQLDPVTLRLPDIGPGAWGKMLNTPRVKIDTNTAKEYAQPKEGLSW